MNTSIGFGDALGFIWSVEKGFTLETNATSHFGYVNILRLLYLIIPLSAFHIASYFSVFFGLLTLFNLYHIGLLNTENKISASMAMLVLGLSFTFWRQAEIVEVYTFNLAIVSFILFLILLALKKKSAQYNVYIATLLGLALLVHIKNILLVPSILFAFFYLNKKEFIKTIIHFLPTIIITSILVVIPLATDSNTLASIFFENSKVLSKAIHYDFKYYFVSFAKHIGYLLYNFHVLIFIILHGVVKMWKGNFIACLILLSAGLPFFVFSTLFDVPDAYVFALIFYLVLAIFSVESLNSILQYNGKVWSIILLWVVVCIAPLFYYSIYQIAQKNAADSAIAQTKAYKGGFKYLLWPGMRHNVGLLLVSKQIQQQSIKPTYLHDMEWNYLAAIEYLEWKQKNKIGK